MNLIQKFNDKQLTKLMEGKEIPEFRAGDSLKVYAKIIEGTTERIQMFEGVCIGRKDRGIGSTFRVRKISNGEGVERIFPLYSPKVEKIEVVRRGKVRQAKLYYMRDLRGKAARIKERISYNKDAKQPAEKKAVQNAAPVNSEESGKE